MINPLEIILELRRYVAMEESGSPASMEFNVSEH
jgi:hypothetical protein